MANSVTSTKALYQAIHRQLQEFLPEDEVSPHVYWLLESLFGKSRMDVVLDRSVEPKEEEENKLEEAISRLQKQEPIQYVLGEAFFYGRTFRVNPAVLIPRPETEELIQLISSQHKEERNLKILDIGTGSGCIAISLALELPQAMVSAIDISKEALAVAGENASALGASVDFILADILQSSPEFPPLDIIVSNPPYVRYQESSLMKANVLDWEPHLALFVENDDALLFYRRISELASEKLIAGGLLYFEINEALGKEVAELLQQQGFNSIIIHQDMKGKDRMVSAKWPQP